MKFEIEKNFMKGSYIVCCNGIEEVVNIQKILLLNEIYWRSSRVYLIEEDVWLRISDGYIQAYGEKEKYLSGYYDINLSGYTFISANKLIRKLKLKKISMCKE